jgi:hypothetical protein
MSCQKTIVLEKKNKEDMAFFVLLFGTPYIVVVPFLYLTLETHSLPCGPLNVCPISTISTLTVYPQLHTDILCLYLNVQYRATKVKPICLSLRSDSVCDILKLCILP